ncbi:MAG: DUF4349 domain-containing protein [Sedimentibacter sp.]
MNCDEIKNLLSLYIDDELDEEERLLVEEHLQKCEDCQKELEEYKKIIQALKNIPDEEPPSGYCKRLHEKLLIVEIPKVITGDKIPKKTMSNKFRWVKYGGMAAALVLVILVYGINNSSMRNNAESKNIVYDYNSSPAAEAPAETRGEAGYGDNQEFAMPSAEEKEKYDFDISATALDDTYAQSNSLMIAATREMKVIKTGSVYVETDDYERFVNDLTAKVQSLGGFLESNNTEVYQVYENEKLMYGNMKLRVPEENFYGLVAYLEESSEVRRKNINETDVTKEYYEKDNKVKNLEAQEEHLRTLYEKAQTVEEMLLIESELTRVRTEIDALNTSLSDIDDRASMSTVNLEVEEVLTANFAITNQDSVWERAKEGFINTVNGVIRTVENLLIYIVSIAPVLIPVVIIFVILVSKFNKYRKSKNKL